MLHLDVAKEMQDSLKTKIESDQQPILNWELDVLTMDL
jgi:hypothetical protein